jgi:uncharacterized membrane protein (DUF373 family)
MEEDIKPIKKTDSAKKNNDLVSKILLIFNGFEKIITVVLCTVIGLIILIALLRIGESFSSLFVADFFKPEDISFEDYQQLFGKIMTLLISLEFMASIIKVLKTHEVKTLILDVVLITALAIARKLIIYDYEHHQASETIALGGLLVAIGIFYFLIKVNIGKSDN